MAKKSKIKPDNVVPEKPKKKGKESRDSSSEIESNKPQRGLAIGENFGWTGKLPATLLFEHCQKMKWGKVTFDMSKNSKGFIGIVNLNKENPKTKEPIHLRMIPDKDLYSPKETTNEARHFAATYAMHRINYVKNMKMVLPVIFRHYWADLETKRLSILKKSKEDHDQIYNADPFQVFLDNVEKRERIQKEKAFREQQEAKTQKPVVNIAAALSKESKSEKLERLKDLPIVPETGNVSFSRKVWERAPFVDIPSSLRVLIENSIRDHINWIDDHSNAMKGGGDSEATKNILLSLGFRELHVKESLYYTKNLNDSLEWLLFHIPEDDLPAFFTKTSEESDIALTISKDLKLEYLLKRLGESAFDQDEIIACLEANGGDEIETSISLSRKITGSNGKISEEDNSELWEQELEGISSIGTNKVEFIDSEKRIAVVNLKPKGLSDDVLSVKLFRSLGYPYDVPGIFIVVNNQSFKLASYIKFAIIRELSSFLSSNNIIGDCFIYTLIEWLEENIERIIKDPGPLISENNVSIHLPLTEKSKTSNKRLSKQITMKKSYQAKDLEALKLKAQMKQSSSTMKNLIEKRSELPAWSKRHELVSVIRSEKVTLVTGETGSGKSTQTIQFILDSLIAECNFSSTIICTQPRRISTIGLAERVSDERDEKVGQEIGYIIRGENKTSKETRATFTTTGVLLRMLQGVLQKGGDTSMFDDLEYIFVDEVHERSVDSDFLLIILKNIINKFPRLKVVLMSATVDVDRYSDFFQMPLNHIHIEGRTYPIEDHYLGEILEELDYTIENSEGERIIPNSESNFFKSGNINYDLIAWLCLDIDKKLHVKQDDGSILIFLPGISEITQCLRVVNNLFAEENRKCTAIPLHSALSSVDQKRVFRRAERGHRKIVFSTNVAETSITIPDCVAVIDCGRSKVLFFDKKINATKLIENWCSKAEINQRRGRAGRIRSGLCYHLYTENTANAMKDQPIPEIKRTRLENLYLVVKAMNVNKVEMFLKDGLDVPDSSSIDSARSFLTEIGALQDNNLTNLGKYLSYLPTDLQSGKLLILGCIFSCLNTCLTLASIMSTGGSPFLTKLENREQVRQILNSYSKGNGDLIGMIKVVEEYENLTKNGKNSKKFISDNNLSFISLREILSAKTQFLSILKDIGFIPMNYNDIYDILNRNSKNYNVIRSVITGALYPSIARVQFPDPKFFKSSSGAIEVDPDERSIKFWIRNPEYADQIKNCQSLGNTFPAIRGFIHPSSVLSSSSKASAESPNLDKYMNEDGVVDLSKAKELYESGKDVSSASSLSKFSFVVYYSSHLSNKLYLRDVTPTTTMATLLLGGEIDYDLSSSVAKGRKSPGVVLDKWLPIRTWSKNGVLIKRLRRLLDGVIDERLSDPKYYFRYSSNEVLDPSENILRIIESVININ